jgi:gamma-glutamyltranspeptidase/glutathione hydrolase
VRLMTQVAAGPPTSSVRGVGGSVATADQAATLAGIGALAAGGNAVDAAIAANAAIAVVAPQLCGMGGDLFALVHCDGEVHALNASGRAGSGSDPEAMRDAGMTTMGFRHDIRSVTVPGCVDGWAALHARFGSLPLADLLAPAITLAEQGFAVSPLLAGAVRRLDARAAANLTALSAASRTGTRLVRPGAGRALRAIAAGGRDAFYGGEFGSGLIELGAGLYSDADLERSQADWVVPLSTAAFGVELHTIPPNSQGYLTLAAARLATAVGLPDDPDDPAWAHLLIEAATAAGFDRPEVLHEGAGGSALLDAIDRRSGLIDRERASGRTLPGADGDTTYLCTVDKHGMGVSLIQSNAAGLGSWLAEPNTGINLHNRGLGFNLTPGHPAELGPGRRPPHTLAPALATRGRALAAVFGTMGGDAQPQILLQVAARLFRHGQSANRAIRAGRWALRGPVTGFDTWTAPEGRVVQVEGHAPGSWLADLAARGHAVEQVEPYSSDFGHAHAIVVEESGVLAGAADPRTVTGSCAAL